MTDLQVTNELKRLVRRIEQAIKILELVHTDRDILEDILTRLNAIESALQLNRENQRETAKTIQADIGEVKDVVEAKVGEVTLNMDEKTVIVKSPKETVVQKILKKIRR